MLDLLLYKFNHIILEENNLGVKEIFGSEIPDKIGFLGLKGPNS